MAESDFEVEYLEEDEDMISIVQQYVTPNLKPSSESLLKAAHTSIPKAGTVRWDQEKRLQKRKHEEDEDYTPLPVQRKPYTKKKLRIEQRVVIPDYSDPICLPVKVVPGANNLVRIKRWNLKCVDWYKKADEFLADNVENADIVVSSRRTTIIQNVKNIIVGQPEPKISNTVYVKFASGLKKTSTYLSDLPKYSDNRKYPLKYHLYPPPRHTGRMVLSHNTVLLSVEDHKTYPRLVTYTPEQRTSLTYTLKDKRKDGDSSITDRELEERSNRLVCAPCYQYGFKDNGYCPQKKNIECVLCGLFFNTTYNMLVHLKKHDKSKLQTNKTLITSTLTKLIGKHYLCKICHNRFNTSTELRHHIATHAGKTLFKCEVGNHVTK